MKMEKVQGVLLFLRFYNNNITDCYSINGILSEELVQCKTLHSVVWNVTFTVICQMSLTWSLAAPARQLINQSLVVISSQF